MREQLKTKTMTQKAVEIYHRFVRYEWEEISDTMKESILEAINEALKISNTSSKTEISDEEIHRQADKEFRHFEDEDKDIWIRACQWYREQLKQRQ
jgi:ectoine hydroxylase-related dioxygenase (phytanoyl-CoA dioxygenase family)